MEFIEAPAFTRYLPDYMDEEQYLQIQNLLATNPEIGTVVPGTGGFRKMRWADERRRKGRRGGLRIIYYYFASLQQIWLLTVYDKGEAADLAPGEKKDLRNALQAEIIAREGKRARKPRRLQ